MTRLENAKKEIKKYFMIDSNKIIPKNDIEAWNKYPEYNFLYNKMFIAEFESIKNGPMPIEPNSYPVVSKPIINLYGMGLSSNIINTKKEFYNNWLSTNFWSEYLKGEHLSWDIIVRDGKIIYYVCFKGHKFNDKEKFGCFSYWELITEEEIKLGDNIKSLIKKYLLNFTGNLNIETIDNKIIEVHLRMGDIDQLPEPVIKFSILNQIIKSKNYDLFLKKALSKYKSTKLDKIYLIPVWYKLHHSSQIDQIINYLKTEWEPKINKNKLIFFYYFDEHQEASPSKYKRFFSLSTYHFELIYKLKYDIEYDLIKNFGR